MIPQIQSLISAARRKGACAQALATLEAAGSLDQLEKEGQLFVWVLWAADQEVMPKKIGDRYYRWRAHPQSELAEMKRETIRAARLWVETGALS